MEERRERGTEGGRDEGEMERQQGMEEGKHHS